MTPEERCGIGNAMWLCSDHAKLIDRDEVTYLADRLHAMKREHEVACARAVRTGTGANLPAGLLALGPDVVCTGELTQIGAASWTLRLGHFLIGDLHRIIAFIDGFAQAAPETRYALSNELGDGLVLTAAPTLAKQLDGYSVDCPIAPATSRVDAQKIGSGFARHPETDDWYANEQGDLARVSGVDYLPQRLHEVLSMQRGESLFSPTFGMRFFEYFETYRGTPWLDLLFKLDIIRQAAIPLADSVMRQTYAPLQCVTRVRNVEVLADAPTLSRRARDWTLDAGGKGVRAEGGTGG